MGAPVAGGEGVRVLVLGASGIIGQHMRLCVPKGVDAVWYRRQPDPITFGVDLQDWETTERLLNMEMPDVVVNLAGESSPDVVQKNYRKYERINVGLPNQLAQWCDANEKRLVQVSSQSVFSGNHPPYMWDRERLPANIYGSQKYQAELTANGYGQTVVRLSFILGVRPLPHVGRKNPLEAMVEGQSPQVNNRWFSPVVVWYAAAAIWEEVSHSSGKPIVHVGQGHYSRYDIAKTVNPEVRPCRHEDFPGIAPRPVDTSYSGADIDQVLRLNIDRAIDNAKRYDRAVELALFFGMRLESAIEKLSMGFGPLHNAVSDDWRRRDPKTDAEILDFYRTTDAYIWELSAYHEDAGFNYAGMCGGIATRLGNEPDCKRVLCLGDGIGDLTLAFHRAGFDARYHDLAGSRTAEYAKFRFWRQTGGQMSVSPTADFFPTAFDECDAVVSLDYLEHVPNVEEWVRAIYAALRPGGLFCAQNAFACGSGPDGAMPMHMDCNDRFEKDWDPLLAAVGFEQLAPQWYRRKS